MTTTGRPPEPAVMHPSVGGAQPQPMRAPAPSATMARRPIVRKKRFEGYSTELRVCAAVLASMVLAFVVPSLRPGIAVAMGIIFVLLSFSRLDLAMGMMLLYLIAPPLLKQSNILGIPGLNPDTIMMLLLLAAVLHKSRTMSDRGDLAVPGRESPRPNPLAIPVIAFLVLTLVSALRSPFVTGYALGNTLPAAKQYAMFALLVLVIPAGLRTRREATTLLASFLVVLGFLLAYSLKDVALNLGNLRFRLDTFIGHPNEFGGFMAIFTPFVITAWLAPGITKKVRLALTGLLGACVICTMYTLSRGSILAALAGLCVIGVIYSRKLLFMVILAALLYSFWIPDVVLDRFEETTAEDTEFGVDNSTGVRFRQWQGLPRMIQDRPLLGHGHESFPFLYGTRVSGRHQGAHSSWLRIMVEEGLLGMGVVIVILGLLGRMAWSVMRRGEGFLASTLGPGMLAALAALVVVNGAGTRFHNAQINSYFWILSGLLVLTWRWLPDARRTRGHESSARSEIVSEDLIRKADRAFLKPKKPAPPART